MKTKPIDEILPRIADEYLQGILNNFSNIIDEIVNYGTHIVLEDIKVNGNTKDNNIPTLFLRNIIELGDSISVLNKNSLIDPAKIQLRTLIENHFGLLYMTEKDEAKRAKSFMVWRAKKDLKYYKQFISSSPSSKSLISNLKKSDINFDIIKYFDRPEMKSAINSKVELLQKNTFKEINKEYIRTAKKLNNKNPNWYSLFNGPRNFLELSNYLNKAVIYEFQYRSFSENVHVTGVLKGFSHVSYNIAQLIQTRDFEHCKEVFISTITHLLECYNNYLVKRLPDIRNDFIEWYKIFKVDYDKIVDESIINYKK